MKPCHPQRFSNSKTHLLGCILLVAFLGSQPTQAQPSGGPYGPIQQRYELPEGPGQIYYVAPDGQPDALGTTLVQPTTLKTVIEHVKTGDAIVLRGGTYRTGDLQLNQGITLQPYEDERPVLKGTFVATEWEPLRHGLWRTAWSHLFPDRPQSWWRRHRHGVETPLYRFNNDMVFVDGRMLQAVGWEGEVDEDTYYIDYDDGHVYVGFNPTNRLVEITAFDNAITRVTGECHGKASDRKGFVARGITFTQYAYRAIEILGKDPEGLSDESQHGKDVVGTTLEHCTLSHCSRVGAYLRGDHLTVRHCLVSDTSTEGIFILSSSDVLLEKNIFRSNNVELITGYFPAAVKIFNQCYRVTCRDNLVVDHPNSSGIWYDVGNVDGVFVNNWVERCNDGFFFEISQRAICAGNVFVDCNKGIRVLNSADVQMYQNTLVNSDVSIERTERSAVGDHFGWHPSTGPDVDERDGHVFVNNLLTGDEKFRIPLIWTDQREVLCEQLTDPQLRQLDYNVYVRRGDTASQTLLVWSPAETEDCRMTFNSLDAFQKQNPKFAAHSLSLENYHGPLFKGSELGRYELLPGFPGASAASKLPAEIQKLLGWQDRDVRFPGAFPVHR